MDFGSEPGVSRGDGSGADELWRLRCFFAYKEEESNAIGADPSSPAIVIGGTTKDIIIISTTTTTMEWPRRAAVKHRRLTCRTRPGSRCFDISHNKEHQKDQRARRRMKRRMRRRRRRRKGRQSEEPSKDQDAHMYLASKQSSHGFVPSSSSSLSSLSSTPPLPPLQHRLIPRHWRKGLSAWISY